MIAIRRGNYKTFVGRADCYELNYLLDWATIGTLANMSFTDRTSAEEGPKARVRREHPLSRGLSYGAADSGLQDFPRTTAMGRGEMMAQEQHNSSEI